MTIVGMDYEDPKFEKEMRNLDRARENAFMRIPTGERRGKTEEKGIGD